MWDSLKGIYKSILTCLLVGLLVFSCKQRNQSKNVTESEVKKNLELFDYGFDFTDSIKIARIELHKIKENHFKLLFFFDEESNFNELQKLNIAFRVYPLKPEEFQQKEDKEAKAKTIGTKCKIQLLENDLVVESGEFEMHPKEFHQAKVFLYDPSEGVVGKMMTILNLNFQKVD